MSAHALVYLQDFKISRDIFPVYGKPSAHLFFKSNRKAMNRNWSNQKANPALKTKTGNK